MTSRSRYDFRGVARDLVERAKKEGYFCRKKVAENDSMDDLMLNKGNS